MVVGFSARLAGLFACPAVAPVACRRSVPEWVLVAHTRNVSTLTVVVGRGSACFLRGLPGPDKFLVMTDTPFESLKFSAATSTHGEDSTTAVAALNQQVNPEPGPPVDMGPSEEAPYGWMVDAKTGERRKKRNHGRTKKGAGLPSGGSPSLEEMKAANPDEPEGDRAPGKPKRSWGSGDKSPKAPPEPAPAFRAGPIAKGMNRLYARTAKVVSVMDPEIGAAILSTTRKDTDDDVTVGEAWEELAKINPRVRVVLLKVIAGGVYGQLFMCHAPIFLAVIMKDGIRQRIPMARFVDAFLNNDDVDQDGAPAGTDLSAMLGGLSPEDAGQMMEMANQMMGQMASQMPRSANGTPVRPAEVIRLEQ